MFFYSQPSWFTALYYESTPKPHIWNSSLTPIEISCQIHQTAKVKGKILMEVDSSRTTVQLLWKWSESFATACTEKISTQWDILEEHVKQCSPTSWSKHQMRQYLFELADAHPPVEFTDLYQSWEGMMLFCQPTLYYYLHKNWWGFYSMCESMWILVCSDVRADTDEQPFLRKYFNLKQLQMSIRTRFTWIERLCETQFSV